MDEPARTSFDRAACEYDAARPSYHPDAIAALGTPGRAVEVGAGTGQCTALLAARGWAVTALEPGPNLAAVLRAKQLPGVRVVESMFETWQPDRRYDLVISAQAFHWIDPAVRYALAARAGRVLAVLWNEKGEMDPELRSELDAAYGGPCEDTPASTRAKYTGEIAASGCFGDVRAEEYPWTRRYTTAQYLALLDTYSDHATMEPARKQALYARIATAIDRKGGAFELPYITMLFSAASR